MAFSPPSVDDIEEQPEFAPPAPDAFDMSGVQPTSQERSLMAGATPETYALPPALNPDWDIVRESKGALPLALMGKAAGAIQHHLVAPLATRILSGLKTATAPQAALLNNGRADITPVEEGKPMLNLPRLTPQEMEAATPAERALAGTGESLAGLYEGFTTPENLALLPLGEAKAVQGLFGTQMAASIPESLQAIGTANTPEDEARAYSSLALNLGLTGAIGHSLMKEGVPNAGKNKKTAEVHGDVRSEPINVESEVSPAEGGPGVQPRTATTPQGEVPLSDEHAKLLAQHMTDDHEFELMGNNEVMRADHATGKVKIDPVEFGRWVDNDLKDLSPKEKAAAIKSAFEHEDIHLKTDPEDAEPFWNSLSPFEQYVLKRNYTKGIDAEVSPQNLGFEAIRNRVERAMGLTRNDFVGLALKERWTAKSLDALAHVVSNIRRLKDSELSTSQKATLDKVMENIGAARNAVPTQQSSQDEQQYTEGPFMRRGEDKPEEGKVRLYRGHDGANGGVYWTSDKAYAQRMGAKLEQLDVPADQLPDHAVRNVEGSGTPNAYKLPPELTKGAQDSGPSEVPVHNLDLTADDLVKRKPGDMTAEEMLSLPDDQVKKLFEANQKRGVATQYDSVLAGMKLLPDDAVELKKVRDQLHKEGMQKLQQGLAAGKTDMPAEFGKVIWLNGAIEGALRKGPNYESVTTARRGGPAKAEGNKGQLDFFKKQGPAMMRRAEKLSEKIEIDKDLEGILEARMMKGLDRQELENMGFEPNLYTTLYEFAQKPESYWGLPGKTRARLVNWFKENEGTGFGRIDLLGQHADYMVKLAKETSKYIDDMRTVFTGPGEYGEGVKQFVNNDIYKQEQELQSFIDGEHDARKLLEQLTGKRYPDYFVPNHGELPAELKHGMSASGTPPGDTPIGNHGGTKLDFFKNEGPAMRRGKGGKPGEQEDMFGVVTKKGIPGEETQDPAARPSAESMGAVEFPEAQTIFPNDIAFDVNYSAPPYRQITESEAKSGRELGEILTKDARSGGSDLPVSATKRLTVLADKLDGSVHVVSTYPVSRPKGLEPFYGPRKSGKVESSVPAQQPIAYIVDPRIAGKERPNRPIEEVLNRYKPVASILVREPRQNYHMKFSSMEDFQTRFGNEAREIVREHGTGTEGIPMTTVGRTGIREPEFTGMAQQPVSNFQFPREQERLKRRPTDQELKAFHDFFGDSLPSDQVMFETRVVRAASTGSRQMISGLRKLIKLEMATHRSWSGGQALTSVLERLYENLKNSETRSEFVSKTLEQSGPGPAETIPEGRGPRATGARELSTIRSKAPTTVEGAEPGEGAPLPEGTTTLTPVEKLSEEDRKAMEAQVERENRQLISPRVIARQLVERKVPSERYTMSGSKSAFDEPADVEEVTDEESKQGEIFPTREVETTKPNKFEEEEEESQGEGSMSLEGDKGTQMEAFNEKSTASRKPERPAGAYWKRQGPAMLRKAEDVSKKVRDYLKVASANISKAGDLSDQLYRLKTSEKADYDLALPVIKSALRVIPESDRPVLMRYADEMQVLKKSDIKLTDAQESIYQTFLKPLLDDNQKMYRDLQKAGVPIGESTYLGRLVQDTHSLYSRLWRGTKQRIVEGSVLGQGASFFKQRVFKALEDDKGNRQLIALVGSGKDTRVISYNKGKADLLGKMPPETLETKGLTPQQIHMQRIVENRRLQALAKLDREEQALMKERDRLDKDPNPDPDRVKGVNERLASINGDYAEVAENYPSQVFDVPRMWRDKSGKMWKFTDATIGEIEGNTNTRYYKEPMSGIITQNMKLKQIYRANQFLDDLKNSPEFNSISRSTNERNVPADWRTVDLQQFHGLRIEPRTADVLDLFAQEQKGPALPLKYVNRLTQFLRNSLFVWNPFVHEPNLLTHWFTARGIEWAKPVGYERMFKSGVASLNDVLTRSRFRDQALRAGAPLLRGMGDINKNVMQLLSKELDSNPSMASKVARGLGYINPLRMIRAFGDSLTWGTNEILTLQLIRETMERTGMSLEDTIAEVGKHMPNYRVPPRVLNSRLVSHVMRNPMLSLWGHYHYGALRSYGEMAKEILSPDSTKTQRLEGLGRVATIGFLMAAVYPTIDDIINKVLKTKGLKMRRAGSATVPSSIIDLMQGKKTPEAVAQSIVTPSPVPAAAAELMFNRNLRTGLPVYDRHIGMDTAKDLGSFAANKISPVEEAGKVFGGKKSGEEFGLGLAGITRTRADSAMSQFGRMADDWMRKNPDPSIREDYKRRTQDVFAESDYQLLRSAVIRGDHSAGQKMVDKLLETRSPNEVARRIKQWQNSPFTGTRKTDRALIEQMTPADLDLWYQAAQERLDISEGMMNHLVEAITKEKK